MASSINASTTAGVVTTADTSGVLNIQTAGTTAISIDASQAVSFTNQPTYSGGTANGVAYLNGSKVLTTGSALVFNGTNLGIGETSPTAKLQIGVASAAVNGTKGVRIANPAGTIVVLECGSGGDSFVGTESGSVFNIRTNNAINATFLTSGNVGFGETSPTQKIHFKGSSTTYALAETTGSGTSSGFRMKAGAGTDFTLYTTQGGNQFGIYNNTTSTQPLTIDASGRLGIGTTTPANVLDVSGASGSLARFKSTGNYSTVIADNTSTTGGGAFAFYKQGGQIGIIGVDGAILGTTSTDVSFFAETGSSLKFYTNGSASVKAMIDTSGNFIYSQSSLACYVWTAFNPTNTSGTTTNAPATGTGYDTGFVTMVNSSGTLTITFDIAGKYLVSTNLQTSHANTYSNERSIFTLGGTATTATGTQDPTFSGIDSVDANTTATYPIYVSATAAQTMTILPTYELTGSGTTAQHTCRPSVTIQYCGG